MTVLCPTGFGYDEPEETLDGVKVRRFSAPPSGKGWAAYLREYALAAVRLRRLVAQEKDRLQVDVAIVCTPPDFLVALALPLRRRGAALVLDPRDPGPELFEAKFGRRGPLYGLLVLLERWALRHADTVTPPNQPCAELVRRRGGVNSDSVFVVGSGPDARRIFPVPPRSELRRGKRHLVLWMGRASEKEGLECLVEAADHLVHTLGRLDVAFAVVGPGETEGLCAEIDRRRLSEVFHVPGVLTDPADVRAYLATADVCVSVDQRNAMNDRSTMMKVFEYMAMGRPVVQFPLAEMKRLCGDTTVYARDADPVDLAEKIASLLDDPERRDRLGAAARRRVLDGLMWGQQAPVLVDAVEAALRRRRSAVSPHASSVFSSERADEVPNDA